MKRGVILQPSFLPWRGYFDLIYRSDIFVFYDDVQYDKHSWRNRNCIKTPQGIQWITVPILTGGRFPQMLLETEICNERAWSEKMLKTIAQNYRKAAYFEVYYPALAQCLSRPWTSLVELDIALSYVIMEMLGLKREFCRSSELNIRSEDRNGRLIEIGKKLNLTHYLSGPSAKSYMDERLFKENQITVEYMTYDYPPYPQLYDRFEPQVSILDLLFNAGPESPHYIWQGPFRKGADVSAMRAAVSPTAPVFIPRRPTA